MTLRILHVEDNPGDARLLREAFALLGTDIEVQSESEADTALSAYARGDRLFDLVILDYNLPKQSGPVLLARFRAVSQSPHQRIIVLTGTALPAATRRTVSADGFFLKPTQWSQWESLGESLLQAAGLHSGQRPGSSRTKKPRERTSQFLRRTRKA